MAFASLSAANYVCALSERIGPGAVKRSVRQMAKENQDCGWTKFAVARHVEVLRNGNAPSRKKGQGRKMGERAKEASDSVSEYVEKSGNAACPNDIAKECDVTKWAARQVPHNDLRLKRARRIQSKRTFGKTRLRRLERGGDLLAPVAKERLNVRKIWRSDESYFRFGDESNYRNNDGLWIRQ